MKLAISVVSKFGQFLDGRKVSFDRQRGHCKAGSDYDRTNGCVLNERKEVRFGTEQYKDCKKQNDDVGGVEQHRQPRQNAGCHQRPLAMFFQKVENQR